MHGEERYLLNIEDEETNIQAASLCLSVLVSLLLCFLLRLSLPSCRFSLLLVFFSFFKFYEKRRKEKTSRVYIHHTIKENNKEEKLMMKKQTRLKREKLERCMHLCKTSSMQFIQTQIGKETDKDKLKKDIDRL